MNSGAIKQSSLIEDEVESPYRRPNKEKASKKDVDTNKVKEDSKRIKISDYKAATKIKTETGESLDENLNQKSRENTLDVNKTTT